MKRNILVVLLVLLVALLLATPALAHTPCASDARGFGVDHIAGHTPHGPPGDFHNPGTEHMGYSLCLGVHD